MDRLTADAAFAQQDECDPILVEAKFAQGMDERLVRSIFEDLMVSKIFLI